MKKPVVIAGTKKVASSFLLLALFLEVAGAILVQLILFWPLTTLAAPVVIDSTVSTAAASSVVLGSQNVFISDTVGYTFYRDRSGACVYSKTTNAGVTWGSAVTVDSQTDCVKIAVWYDRWTPGDTTGTNIHIATFDVGDDDLFYNRLNTSGDTLLTGATAINASVNSGQGAVLSNAGNSQSITKATNGAVYMAVSDVQDSFVVSCSSSCASTTGWNEVGTNPLDAANDHNLLMPLAGGSVILINRDISANDLRSKIWNGTSWSASWNTFESNAPNNATYDGGFSATQDLDTFTIYLGYAADHNNYTVADHDIRTAVYSGGWTNTTDVFTNIVGRGLHDMSIARDQNTGNLYIAYAIQDTINNNASANVYYRISTNNMSSWGAEQGPLNATPGNIYTPVMNIMNFERIYATWYNGTNGTLYGETVADIGPDTLLSALGTANAQVRTGSTNFYTGGKFVLTTKSTRNVSTITLTENGTIDAQNRVNNVKVFYDLDTTAPYDCVSETYSGGEPQFGSTDTNGFSGTDGVSSFSGSIVSISPTQTMCFYTVVDVLSGAVDGSTLNILIANPSTDITISGETVYPTTAIDITGNSVVVSPNLTQSHFHWRNDNGSEASATSATGGSQDVSLPALSKNNPRRLRLEVSNEGSTTTLPSAFTLEYGTAAPTCDAVTIWTDVGSASDAWDMFNSANITDGNNTTNIAVGNGGVTDENTTFLTPNGGVRDTNSTTGSLTLGTANFLELEYSVVATATAVEGETYCFRVSNSGTPLSTYSSYPTATIAADVQVSSIGSQTTTIDVPTTDSYLGGAIVVAETSGTRSVTGVTLSENGTVDASTGLSDIKLFYDLDTTAPYNCASESYSGTEPQYGSTIIGGFSAEDGTATISGSVAISTTITACFYVVATITETAQNGQTVEVYLESPTADISVSGGGSVAPSAPVELPGTTTLRGAVLTQTHYQWRNDNGSETTATSYTGGVEDTPVNNFTLDTPIRLRFGVSNEGAAASVPTRFRIEYGPKITTCDAVNVWTDVDAGLLDDWDMRNTANLTDGADTTNIGVSNGGVTDENTTFLTPNGGVKDTSSLSASTTLTTTQHTDLEFSLKSTPNTAYSTTYCFRVSANGTALLGYDSYAEITTTSKRDFRIQHGTTTISGTTATIVAGVDYTAPASTSRAFIRLTNTHHTASGKDAGGGAQNANDVTAYISDPENIGTSITFERDAAVNNTFVSWEIIEFVGQIGTDNEIVVRDIGTVSLSSVSLTVDGSSIGVSNDSKVVVFITGIQNQNTSRNYYAGQVTSEWLAGSDTPRFTRGATGGATVLVSYAVVEFTGVNWAIQRSEHAYTSSGVIETESITPVSSLERTFLHTQKRMGDASTNVVHFGHTVWLSSIGAVSYELESGSNTADHVSVAWIIENTQNGLGSMVVQRQSGGTINGSEPLALQITIPIPVSAVNNTSLFGNSRAVGTNNGYPRPLAGLSLTSTTTYEIWRSDTGTQLTYRTEIVEWPVADLAIRQNYYRVYADNNELTPVDPWPPGVVDIGENTPVTATDEPLGEGDVVRLRMSARISNANLSPGFQTFKLQFGRRLTTCTAVADWADVGSAASSEVWRGYAATGTADGTELSTDPPGVGELLLSVSDVAGRLEHENPSVANPYTVFDGEDVEFDWYIQQNGAIPSNPYCFRMIRGDDEPLESYLNYPTIRTAGFSPATQNWRWYDDSENETPTTPLSAENVAPSSVENQNTITLRVTVDELKNVTGSDVKFKLQYSEYPDFSVVNDLVPSTSCQTASIWCYEDAAVADNTTITTSVLSDGDGCVGSTGNGCGTHNSSGIYTTGHLHGSGKAQEYSFTILSAAPRVNATYYFRLVDLSTDVPVSVALGETYPTLITELSTLDFSIAGLPSGTTTAGVVTDATTSATGVGFGSLPIGDDQVAAQRITVNTNATEGFQILKFARSELISSNGSTIASLTSTNAAPASWTGTCTGLVLGCVGYHTTDATLSANATRFAALDTYSGFHTDPEQVIYSSLPLTTTEDIVYRILVNQLQPAGDYETDIVYIAVPVY